MYTLKFVDPILRLALILHEWKRCVDSSKLQLIADDGNTYILILSLLWMLTSHKLFEKCRLHLPMRMREITKAHSSLTIEENFLVVDYQELLIHTI